MNFSNFLKIFIVPFACLILPLTAETDHANFSEGGTNIIHWGFPAENSSNQLAGTFLLGKYTHFNFPIKGKTLTHLVGNYKLHDNNIGKYQKKMTMHPP